MKVYNLQCQMGHGFEGWFSSEADYDSQQLRGLLTCPVCDNAQVKRMPSAPRLNLSHTEAAHPSVLEPAADALPTLSSSAKPHVNDADEGQARRVAAWLQMARHVVENTEDVGKAFAKEASKMHHGEAPDRPIRGQASPEEKQALRDEGIEVAEMLIPVFLTKPLQ